MPRSASPSSTSSIASRGEPRARPFGNFGANARNNARNDELAGEPSRVSRLLREARWLAFAALAIYLFLILVTYSVGDPGWSHDAVVASLGNRGGRFGAWLADVLLSVFGYSAYWLIVLFASRVAIGYRALVRSRLLPDDDMPPEPVWVHVTGFVVMLVASCGIEYLRAAGLSHGLPQGPGGVIGGEEVRLLTHAFGMTGATLALLVVFAIGFSLFTGWSWLVIAERVGGALEGTVMLFKLRREARADRAVGAEAAVHREEVVVQERTRIEDAPPIRIEPQVVAVPQSTRIIKEKQVPLFAEIPETDLPPLSLLAPPPVMQETVSPETLEFTSRLIEKKLKDFGVDVQVVAAHPGPIITRYEIEPATGVKGSQIVNLAKDLARALSLVSIRVVETIPGKTTMGLELPNPRRQAVRLSEILGSQVYNESPSPLTLALGKDIAGRPVIADLSKMPHLLVAGTTGSGKSVGINAMILSLLYKAEANQVRLIMIDPKMLELSVYEGIAHLLAPVVTDMRQAGHALNWAVAEMERRYKLMSKLGVRNLAGYNNKIAEAAKREEKIGNPFSLTPEAPEPLDKLPTIVIVIDELADLMMVVGKKVEELIARIAQKARAAGIHLILATQRPSVDVITGLI
ncbi:MAG: DNA translocase FtsK, partial [Burkholderiaceae bacterium]